ncbi:MAG: hypothetical protein KJO95_08305 [Gammaproteobacteria bacterium]|nr:hypothetical protein [Gammaproteobacteria bacterium]MBU2677829.1 hypothetical protein [Gammaproteobacteria bacterium]NNL51562.1 hypothetical protein [Woeseiaceae bacterium]
MRKPLAVFIAGIATLAVAGCDVEQTREAKLPKVDVKVDKGQLPAYEIKQTKKARIPAVDVAVESGQLPEVEVETADIEVGRKEISVPIPDVELKDTKVTVPTVDIEMPDERDMDIPDERDMAEEAREKAVDDMTASGS